MENNTISINCKTGKVVHSYVKQVQDEPYLPTKHDYEQLVATKIRSKYTQDQELAILRQKEDKPSEYQEYYAFCEQCKQEAREDLTE